MNRPLLRTTLKQTQDTGDGIVPRIAHLMQRSKATGDVGGHADSFKLSELLDNFSRGPECS